MRSYTLVFGLTTLLAAGATFLACGSSSSNNPTGTDSGTESDSGGGADGSTTDDGGGTMVDSSVKADSGTPGQDSGTKVDSGTAVASGTALVDAAAPPGTPLALSASGYFVWAVTPDGYAVYTDRLTGSNNPTLHVYAMPIDSTDGGGSQLLATLSNVANPQIANIGNVVYVYHDVVTASAKQGPHSPLSIWTSTGGWKHLSDTSLTGFFYASADASAVMYLDNVSAGVAATGDLYGAPTAGATAPTALETGIVTNEIAAGKCFPRGAFGQGTATTVAAALWCSGTSDASGAATDGTVSTWLFDVATGAFSHQATDVNGMNGSQPTLALDTTGSTLFTTKANQDAVAFAVAAGVITPTPTTVDSNVFSGILLPDGSKALYGQAPPDGGTPLLRTAATTAPTSPVTLVSSSFVGFYSLLSPDNRWLYTFSAQNTSTGFTDMWLANTATASTSGAPVQLSTTQSGALFSSPFTADSKFALWYDPVVQGFGAFKATDLTGTPPTSFSVTSSDVWNDFALGTTGSKISYNDNCSSNTTNQLASTCDIQVATLAAGSTTVSPTKIVAQADANYWPSADGTKLVFTYYVAKSANLINGLYVVATP